MKVSVTNELARLIQTTRIQRRMASKELARAIGKSPSYLSKLEKGEIQRISLDGVKKIFGITMESETGNDFYLDILPVLIRILDSFVPDEQFRTQAWLLQLDLIERPIMIPETLRREIRRRMDGLEISADTLHQEIVKAASMEMTVSIPTDTVVVEQQGEHSRLIYHSGVTAAELNALINGTSEETNFLTISEILYNLIRLKSYAATHLIPEEARNVLQENNTVMESYGIVPLVGFHRLYSADLLMSQEWIRYGHLANGLTAPVAERVINTLSVANTFDPSGTTAALMAFERNVEWDPAFMIKLIGLPYSELGRLSHSRKKELLDRVEAMLEEYDRLPSFEKEYEKY